ncbi:hypothetical protein GCM10017083_04980 [Thalassobaculum fulvum]|uniref:DUF4062 domain-containing protein n=2 Tax=Thalassobaculum fulvum TaxID=1633335 RepID=A0A919CP49_9PROT|nr:hypothetical protein GCM10017083_04980 [Thalassobaculum fulvum]
MDCIPAGMEMFPASNEEQFEFIKKIIDDCDYYVLIIGGRYGSTGADGISYTEKEYDYAKSIGLDVLGFVHANVDEIVVAKTDKDEDARQRLSAFRKKVCEGRLVKMWSDSKELPGLVSLSLHMAMKMNPAVGWIRASHAGSRELLEQVNKLREENEKLRNDIKKTTPIKFSFDDIADLEDKFTISGRVLRNTNEHERNWSHEFTWSDIFYMISPGLLQYPSHDSVKKDLELAVKKRVYPGGYSFRIDPQIFETISIQLKSLGLVTTKYAETVKGGMALFWSLTPAGERKMFELRIVRKSS